MRTSIRSGTADDAATLAELAARTFGETFAANTQPEDMASHVASAYGPAIQHAELVDPDITTLLVEIDENLAGFAQVRSGETPDCIDGESPLELWRFYIAREWHGRGIAHDLMQHVETESLKRGARTLWLGVWEHNERAKAFYRKFGFRDVGSHIYMVGSDPQTDRIFVRSITEARTGDKGLKRVDSGEAHRIEERE